LASSPRCLEKFSLYTRENVRLPSSLFSSQIARPYEKPLAWQLLAKGDNDKLMGVTSGFDSFDPDDSGRVESDVVQFARSSRD
jgi:hypothetical protein